MSPPGPGAATCATCAGMPVTCACTSCGTEDKLYERGLCARCSLRRRATALLTGPGGGIPAALAPVLEAICAARNPRSALNWLSRSEAAALLAQVTSGTLPATHQALDACPRRRAADQMRQMLVAGGVLPPRDEELARAEQWLAALLSDITDPGHRQLVRAFATWHVHAPPAPRRRGQAPAPDPHRPRAEHHQRSRPAPGLARRAGDRPAGCRQADIDEWLVTSPGACNVRDFLTWAARRGHCPPLDVPRPAAPRRDRDQPATSAGNWRPGCCTTAPLDPVDRAAGCLVLLYGQHASRIAALTTSKVTSHGNDEDVTIQLGQHDIPVPPRSAGCCSRSLPKASPTPAPERPGTGNGCSQDCCPARPITPERLAGRLRAIGIPVMAGRRAALIDLAAQVPAAVLADTLGFHPATAVRWRHQAGADWNRYAAELARDPQSRTRGIAPGRSAQAEVFSTVGTLLSTSFNRDVPQHIVQKILDHDSPEMTAHYARLSDKTVREHWEKARKVSAAGEPVRISPGGPLGDAAWASTSCHAPPRHCPTATASSPWSEDLPARQRPVN